MTDLIDECGKDLLDCGYETVKLAKYDMTCSKLFVCSNRKSDDIGFDKGHYFILNAPKMSYFLDEHCGLLENEILYRLQFLLKTNNVSKKDKILFVGIGNPDIVADSFGAKVVEKIEIQPFKKNNKLFKFVPNTFQNTGFNAYEMIRLFVEAFDISAIFLFDSLATNNIFRLGNSLQFNDAGLTPGSAINNFGMAINKSTLNVPCFSFGAPLMLLTNQTDLKRDIVLTEKDINSKVDFLSYVVSNVINKLF